AAPAAPAMQPADRTVVRVPSGGTFRPIALSSARHTPVGGGPQYRPRSRTAPAPPMATLPPHPCSASQYDDIRYGNHRVFRPIVQRIQPDRVLLAFQQE